MTTLRISLKKYFQSQFLLGTKYLEGLLINFKKSYKGVHKIIWLYEEVI